MHKGFTDIDRIAAVNLHEIGRRVKCAQLENGAARLATLREAAAFAEGLAAILRLESDMCEKYPEMAKEEYL